MLIEANLIVSNLLQCHNNASIITSKDAGEAVEEYAAAYMTKEGAPLRQAAAVLLAAVDHIARYTSKAEDSGTVERTGKHLAQRTLNSFTGSHQWSMPLMVYALHGFKSYATTEAFTYIFPHDNVSNFDEVPEEAAQKGNVENVGQEDVADPSIMDLLNSVNKLPANDNKGFVGATSYKVGQKCIFLNQAVSYVNRGKCFEPYGQLEFECIVELLPKKGEQQNRGRRQRTGFNLGDKHPLFASHQGFLRAKMRTAILGGHPPPTFPGNYPTKDADKSDEALREWWNGMNSYSKFLMCFMVPWDKSSKQMFPFDADGLKSLLDQWDRKSAPLLSRQRFRTIHNFMSKGNRSTRNEQTASGWRERDAARWADMGHPAKSTAPPEEDNDDNGGVRINLLHDLEAESCLTSKELYQLTSNVANADETRNQAMSLLRDMCRELHASEIKEQGSADNIGSGERRMPVVHLHRSNLHETDTGLQECVEPTLSLSEILKQITKMKDDTATSEVVTSDHEEDGDHAGSVPGLVLHSPKLGEEEAENTCPDSTKRRTGLANCTLTADQDNLVTAILEQKDGYEMVFLHSGGGTGKSTVVCRLNELLKDRGFTQANCCPTGVGATNLPQGRTFHSMFKPKLTGLSAGEAIDKMKEQLGGDKLRLVVVDEVSMLEAQFLILLDHRLKAMYNPTKMFGGIQVLLLGDFLQLPSVAGTPLFRAMYSHLKTDESPARALFANFKVVSLQQQMRAAKDPQHQELLLDCRALPDKYPDPGATWSAADRQLYHPITPAIVEAVTNELTREDVVNDPDWTMKGVCITTGNLDRSVINATIAPIFAAATGQTIVRWRRKLKKEVPQSLSGLLYSEEKYPELFGHFVYGAPGQILDNGSGNVCFGVANGTACKMISLGWDNPAKQLAMSNLVAQSLEIEGQEKMIDIPHAPDFIIVEVEVNDADRWPSQLNLSGQAGVIHIPIGLKTNRANSKDSLSFGDKSELGYLAHAVDLAFAITVWKSQGGTFDYVIALLENTPNSPSLTFEMLYVMFSRVRLGCRFRCMPLTLPSRTRGKLKKLMPNIYATRWRMDVIEFGKWVSRQQEEVVSPGIYKPRARRATKASTQKKKELRKEQQKAASIKERTNKDFCTNNPVTGNKRKRESERGTDNEQHHTKILKPVHGQNKRKNPEDSAPSPDEQQQERAHHLPVLTCDGSPLYPHLKPASDNIQWPAGQSRAMMLETGLPIRDEEEWRGFTFTTQGWSTLEPEVWLSNDPVDLFSLLDCQTSSRVSYIPSSYFSLFKQKLITEANPHPIIYHHSRSHAMQMLEQPMWLSITNHNRNHWQALCIINHGKPNCLALLMDSLAPSSNLQLLQTFAADYIDQVYLAAGQPIPTRGTHLLVHQCIVLRQPNGYDCGVFSLLNLKNCVYHIDEMLKLSPPATTSLAEEFDFSWWYGLLTAVHYRSYLHQRYHELLALYSQPN